MTESLNIDLLEQALRYIGENLPCGFEVKIIIVGGAAGMLTGILPVGRTTFDCDVILCEPTDRLAELENIASGVAEKLGLPPRWLNADVQLLFNVLNSACQEFHCDQVRSAHRPNHKASARACTGTPTFQTVTSRTRGKIPNHHSARFPTARQRIKEQLNICVEPPWRQSEFLRNTTCNIF